MKITRIITGELVENCYVISNDNKCLIVDPGDDFYKIEKKIKDLDLCGILITHHHFDHVGALDDVLNYKKVPIYDYSSKKQEYNIDGFKFEIIKTPGHTSDSITFYFKEENIMFTGDFIFRGTIGRTDLPTGNELEMMQSINMIKKYNKNIIIYPGHGNDTTLEYEISNNYFFNNL